MKMRMANVSDSCKKHFLVLYEKYQKAKKKNGPVIWAKAVLCREYIQKIADPDKEADTFEEILAGSTTKEQAAESFRELCEDSKSSPRKSLLSRCFLIASETMLIQAYRVESRRHGSIGFEPPEPIGIVHFTQGIVQREIEFEPDTEAIKVLSKHNLAAHHQAIDISTWKVELISLDDDLLGTPFVENATEGYRIWLPS